MSERFFAPGNLRASDIGPNGLSLTWDAVTRKRVTVPGDVPGETTLLLHGDGNLTDDMGLNTPSWYGTAGYAAGKFGQAMNLTGSNCVKIPYGPNVTFGSNDFTIACWVKQTQRIAGEYPRVWCHQYRYNASYTSYGLVVELDPSGVLTAYYQKNYDNRIQVAAGYTLPLNQWVHIAMVRYGGTISLYINGTVLGSAAVSGAIYQNSNASFKLGAGTNETQSNDDPVFFLRGQIDEFIVVNGSALWTSNFTPPSKAYVKGTSQTVTAAPAGYRVYKDGALTGTASQISFRAEGLAGDTEYTFGVEAYGGAADGEWSAIAVRTADGVVVPSVTAVSVTPNPNIASAALTISVSITEIVIILEPEKRYAGEFYSGEV